MAKPGNDRRIDNIEIAVSDIARSRTFYGKAFGWTTARPIASSAMGG
jgi:predicted enzyme related to lactoylglutathione lyase